MAEGDSAKSVRIATAGDWRCRSGAPNCDSMDGGATGDEAQNGTGCAYDDGEFRGEFAILLGASECSAYIFTYDFDGFAVEKLKKYAIIVVEDESFYDVQ